jgi:hypothetical protein
VSLVSHLLAQVSRDRDPFTLYTKRWRQKSRAGILWPEAQGAALASWFYLDIWPHSKTFFTVKPRITDLEKMCLKIRLYVPIGIKKTEKFTNQEVNPDRNRSKIRQLDSFCVLEFIHRVLLKSLNKFKTWNVTVFRRMKLPSSTGKRGGGRGTNRNTWRIILRNILNVKVLRFLRVLKNGNIRSKKSTNIRPSRTLS